MGDGDVADAERAERHLGTELKLVQRHLAVEPGLRQPGAHQAGGEAGRIDRTVEARPEMGDGALMVLVGMGQHEAEQVVLHPLDEADVGHHHVDAGSRIVAEGDAALDHDPLALAAVEVAVHADLARAAERQVDEARSGRGDDGGERIVHHAARLRCATSTMPRRVSSGSVASITSVPSANSGARPPVAITVNGPPSAYSALIRATMPSIRPR